MVIYGNERGPTSDRFHFPIRYHASSPGRDGQNDQAVDHLLSQAL